MPASNCSASRTRGRRWRARSATCWPTRSSARWRPSRIPAGARQAQGKPAGASRILLVEDDDESRVNSAELLEVLGHTVLQVRDGEAALALLRSTAIDVLVTDIGLPGMSGEELAACARAALPSLGVVFASGQDNDSDLAGVVVLRKPYDSAALDQAVRAARKAVVG